MRKFITLGKVGADGTWEMVIPPDQPYEEHRSYVKAIKLAGNTHPRYSEVILAPVQPETRLDLTGYSTEVETLTPPPIPGVVTEPREPFPQQEQQTPPPAPEPTPAPAAEPPPAPEPESTQTQEPEPDPVPEADFEVTSKRTRKSK